VVNNLGDKMSKILGIIYYTLAGIGAAGGIYGAVNGNFPATVILGASAGLGYGFGKAEFDHWEEEDLWNDGELPTKKSE